MARQSEASRRREERQASERRQRLIVTSVIASLAVVAAIIAAGLYMTQYRAPRAHVLTLDGRDYDTSAIARRGTYFALFEGGFRGQSSASMADTVVELLIDEAVLRASAPELVGAVGDSEVEEALHERFGLTEGDDRARFAELLQTRIQDSGLSRDEFYELIATSVLRVRLSDRFQESVDPSAPQIRLSRIRLTTKAEAEEVRQLSADGGDFAALTLERTADSAHREDGGDLGWSTVEALEPAVAEAVADLEAGDLSPVLAVGIFFDVYLVAERDEARELDGAQIAAKVGEQFDAWFEEGRLRMNSQVGLSSGESDWIADRIVSDVNRALGG